MDERRKKLQFRAWRRGFREIDLILGGFADRHGESLTEAELAAFEGLLNANDQDVYAWITGAAAPQAPHDTPLMARLRAFEVRHPSRQDT
jgi:antitoxin CptB